MAYGADEIRVLTAILKLHSCEAHGLILRL